MREGISIAVRAADRERLAAVVADRNSPPKHVWRGGVILAPAGGWGPGGSSAPRRGPHALWWRSEKQFRCGGGGQGGSRRGGGAGLRREKTRTPGRPPLPPAQIARVVELTLAEPPGAATHWTGRAMAAATGISLRSVQRIWAAHGLQPHRVR